MRLLIVSPKPSAIHSARKKMKPKSLTKKTIFKNLAFTYVRLGS